MNLEYLAKVVFTNDENVLYPDSLVGTDSHTTMINGLGVMGWGCVPTTNRVRLAWVRELCDCDEGSFLWTMVRGGNRSAPRGLC